MAREWRRPTDLAITMHGALFDAAVGVLAVGDRLIGGAMRGMALRMALPP